MTVLRPPLLPDMNPAIEYRFSGNGEKGALRYLSRINELQEYMLARLRSVTDVTSTLSLSLSLSLYFS